MLAIATLGFLAGATLAWYGDDSGLAGLLARVGAVFAAIWIAYPALVRVDRRTTWILALGAAVVLFRPRSAFVVLPVVAIFARSAKVGGGSADR